MKMLIRTLHPETKVLSEKEGLVEYVASDETLDCHREVVRAGGWKFTNFRKNAPFLDSHQYRSIMDSLGSVMDFRVDKGRLIETVKWAIDVAENTLARFGFEMTKAGYLKAVSVGFNPTKTVSQWDNDLTAYKAELADLGYKVDSAAMPRVIYVEQEQLELSACVIGANPNALARAYKSGIIDDAGIDMISEKLAERKTASMAANAARAVEARGQQRAKFLGEMQRLLKRV